MRRSYIGRHVTKLLRKPEIQKEETGGHFFVVKLVSLDTVWRLRYRWREGFRYPTALLSVCLVGGIAVYMLTVGFIYYTHQLELIRRKLDNSSQCTVCEFLSKHLRTVVICLYVSLVLSGVICVVNLLHSLTSFRANLQALHKGDHSTVPSVHMSSNSVHCVGSLKYGGFQVAYIIWGYFIQSFVIFVICVVIGFFPDCVVSLLQQYWPIVLSFVIMLIVQRLLAIFVFLQDRAAYLALDNRGFYFTFNYFMFFYNIFIGLVSCLLRLVKSMIIGTLFLSRLDYCILPRKFEFLDPGFKAYVGYLQMENAHTHPVLLVFTKLLLLQATSGLSSAQDNHRNYHINLSAITDDDGRASRTRRGRSVRKWHVTYTLLRNPDLVYTRKIFNQTATSRALAVRGTTYNEHMTSADNIYVTFPHVGH